MGMMEEWRGVSGERVERMGGVREGRRSQRGEEMGNISLSAQSGYSMVFCDTSGVAVQFNGYEGGDEGGREGERGERREGRG